jgi:hypothetical protein
MLFYNNKKNNYILPRMKNNMCVIMKTDITSAQKICGQVGQSFLSYCTNADHIFISWYLFYSELNH